MGVTNNQLNLTPITGSTFQEIINNIEKRFSEYNIYKGDKGISPQIQDRRIVNEGVDGTPTYSDFTAMGKILLKYIFEITDETELITFLTNNPTKLDYFKTVVTLPWWCADGYADAPVYPAASLVYIDTEENSEDKIDYTCTLTAQYLVDSNDTEPNIAYSKSHLFPTLYYDGSAMEGNGAWCWKINGLETGIAAAIANADLDRLVAGKLFLIKKETEEGEEIYKYYTTIGSTTGWYKYDDLNIKPIENDLGYLLSTTSISVGTSEPRTIQVLHVCIYTNGDWKPAPDEQGSTRALITYDDTYLAYIWNSLNFKNVKFEKIQFCLSDEIQNHFFGVNSTTPNNFEIEHIDDTATTQDAGNILLKNYNGIYVGTIDEDHRLATKSEAGGAITSVGIADLITLKSEGKLSGTYRITDYNPGHQFDIIVTADSSTTLNAWARAIRHINDDGEVDTYFDSDQHLEDWILKVHLGDTLEVVYMKDDHGNECDWDFKNTITITSGTESVTGYTFQYFSETSSTNVDASINDKARNNILKYKDIYIVGKDGVTSDEIHNKNDISKNILNISFDTSSATSTESDSITIKSIYSPHNIDKNKYKCELLSSTQYMTYKITTDIDNLSSKNIIVSYIPNYSVITGSELDGQCIPSVYIQSINDKTINIISKYYTYEAGSSVGTYGIYSLPLNILNIKIEGF